MEIRLGEMESIGIEAYLDIFFDLNGAHCVNWVYELKYTVRRL
jgi:hypothetical protein